MKIIVLVLCAVFAVASADWEPKTFAEMVTIRDECFKSEKVSEVNIAKIKKNEYPEEQEARCYLRCSVEKYGNWNDENGYSLERTQKQLEKTDNKVSLENLGKCLSVNNKNLDACTRAFEGFKCLLDNKYVVFQVVD